MSDRKKRRLPDHRLKVKLGEACRHPCPLCDGQMILRDSRYGLFYSCERWPKCDCTHGAHPDGRPLGRPADNHTKRCRMKVHSLYDMLWRYCGVRRNRCYAWMQKTMKMTKRQAHIAKFDVGNCAALEYVLKRDWGTFLRIALDIRADELAKLKGVRRAHV